MPSYVDRISNVYLRRRMFDQGSLHERSDKVGKIEVIIKDELQATRITIQAAGHAGDISNVCLTTMPNRIATSTPEGSTTMAEYQRGNVRKDKGTLPRQPLEPATRDGRT